MGGWNKWELLLWKYKRAIMIYEEYIYKLYNYNYYHMWNKYIYYKLQLYLLKIVISIIMF